MENILFLGVPILKHIRVTIFFQVVQGQGMKLYQVHYLSVCCVLHFASLLKGWILCYTVDPPNLIPSNRQVIRKSKVSANHLIIRVIKYCRDETTARFRGPSGVYS